MNEKRIQQQNSAQKTVRAASVAGGVFVAGLGIKFALTGVDFFVLLGMVGIIAGLAIIYAGVKPHAELSKNYEDSEADPRSTLRQVLDDDLSPYEIKYKKRRTAKRAKYGAPKTRYGGMFQVLWSIVYFPLVIGFLIADMGRMTTAESLGAWRTLIVAVAGLAFYFWAFKRIDK